MRGLLAVTVWVYVGTYTSGESKGIYRLAFDTATGTLSMAGEPTPSVNPSFLALHPSGRFLYAVNETGESRTDASGGVSAYAVDATTGSLTFLNRQPSGGPAPCHLSLDKDSRHLFVANYWGGSVAALPLQADGRLGAATSVVRHEGRGPHPQRQEAPHVHSVQPDPASGRILVADLGLDKLAAYRLDAERGALTADESGSVRLAAGSGPRHFAFNADASRLYVLNELASTLAVFRREASGAFTELQTVPTLPADIKKDNTTAEIVIRPDGRFAYASNRGHDSIAVFAIDAASGRLTPAGHVPTGGRKPRHFAIDPSGAYLLAANQDSDSIVVFRIDAASGGLSPVGTPFRVPKPVCVRMAPPR